MNYTELKHLDEVSLKKIKEWNKKNGYADECLCDILAPMIVKRSGLKKSIKTAFQNISKHKWNTPHGGMKWVGRKTIQGNPSCKKCPCAHSSCPIKETTATLEIITPDISTICPCPEDEHCFPEVTKLMKNNIQIIERVDIPNMPEKKSGVKIESEKIEEQDSMASTTNTDSHRDVHKTND